MRTDTTDLIFFGDLWRSMEEDAILIGLDLNYFWSLNVKQFNKHIQAYNKRRKQEIEDNDYLNYILGKYISFAFNDPKHYPSKPVLYSIKKNMSDEEMERQAKYNTIRLGGVIK